MKGLKADGTPIRVMAVDDSPITRKMIRKALEPEGFEIVAEAGNGKEALEVYSKVQPDVITMDVTMPIMDGLDAAGAIKKLNPSQRIVMLSAMGDADIIADAQSRGITDFCTKPFKPQEMVDKVLELMSR
ncbi:response regulator [Syntrophomonas palmitatica]|uniref:response regulator n=1 Tax=Syntrophomonas palmitatica TaxID=402877 RepID=UPI0006D00DB3|nr:response regulator [Syntrophomonas palmitatica]